MTKTQESSGINWGRILACGLIAGFAWTLLSIGLLTLIGTDFLSALGGGRLDQPNPGIHKLLFFINHACGIWAIWLFAAIRPRFNSTGRTAIIAGLGWWVISSLQSFKWVTLGAVPFKTTLLPFAATLPAMVLALFLGAWFYEK